jgi:predicted KAP-like P-loop ATPase
LNWISRVLRPSDTGKQVGSLGAEDEAATKRVLRSPTIAGDNPIRFPANDTIGRTNAAASFAGQILTLDATEGLVVGVLGPWGSGKTSFINLARICLEDAGVSVLDFNPWMFSGAEQLIDSFFVELSAQLKLRPELSDIGESLEEYGEIFSGMAWVPFVGPWLERGREAAKLLGRFLQRRKEGVGGRRAKVAKALAVLEMPLAVVLDDIDRLTTSEIRDIFKLVRLTANFPNVIYIVAFDRERVELALGEQGIPGRAYLEKIIQLGVDLPSLPRHVLDKQIFTAIDAALDQIEDLGGFDKDIWPDVFVEIIRPLIGNMRDVRRYASAIQGTVGDLNGQIALVDVLALEAIRVCTPQ